MATKNLGYHIEISIRDDGPIMPNPIKDRIFQLFFTTKPTGRGAELGYDIVKPQKEISRLTDELPMK